MTMAALSCRGVSASYGDRVVFSGIGLDLATGIHALVGPNGIGKSTLLRILAGMRAADAGEVWIGGENLARAPRKARMRLSYAPDEVAVYPFMTGRDLLELCAWAKGVPPGRAIGDAVEGLGLGGHLDTRFDAMSLGTARKMSICAALTGAPDVLILDEPCNGLDAAALDYLAGVLRDLGRRGVVLISSHDAAFLRGVDARVIAMEDLRASPPA